MSQWIYKARARARAEDGVSLVELLMSILIIGIVMGAMAQALIASLQGTKRNEERVAATAAAQQFVEQLYSIDWNLAELYEDFVDGTYTATYDFDGDGDAGDTDDKLGWKNAWTRWQTRVTDTTIDGETVQQYDGNTLVTRENPASEADRNPNAPQPFAQQEIDGIIYNVDRYITAVDRDGDGVADTKRYVAAVSWTDRFGNDIEVFFESERQPTSFEKREVEGAFLITFATVSEAVVDVDATGEIQPNGFVAEDDISLLALMNEPTTIVRATVEVIDPDTIVRDVDDIDEDGDTTEVLSYDTKLATIDLDPVEPFVDGGWTRFELADLRTAGLQFENGDADFYFEAFGTGAVPDSDREVAAARFTGGPFGADPDPGTAPGQGTIQNLSLDSDTPTWDACNGTKELAHQMKIRVTTFDIEATADWPTLTYEYWTKDNVSNANFKKSQPAAQSIKLDEGIVNGRRKVTWIFSVDGVEGVRFWHPGETIRLIADHDNATPVVQSIVVSGVTCT